MQSLHTVNFMTKKEKAHSKSLLQFQILFNFLRFGLLD